MMTSGHWRPVYPGNQCAWMNLLQTLQVRNSCDALLSETTLSLEKETTQHQAPTVDLSPHSKDALLQAYDQKRITSSPLQEHL